VYNLYDFEVYDKNRWIPATIQEKIYRFKRADNTIMDIPFSHSTTHIRYKAKTKRKLETIELSNKIPRLLYVLMQGKNKEAEKLLAGAIQEAEKNVTPSLQTSMSTNPYLKQIATGVLGLQQSF
jgi:hypothetical protein